jgi:hypothetical protein
VSTNEQRTYRLAPPDRTGYVFGLGVGQLVTLGASTAVGSVAMMLGRVAVGIGVVGIGAIVGVGRWRSASLLEWLPHTARYFSQQIGGRTWLAPTVMLGGSPSPVPPVFAGLSLIVVEPTTGNGLTRPAVVTADTHAAIYAATVRVTGRALALLDGDAQDLALSGWGAALQALVAERPAVCQLRWSAWTAPVGLNDHRRWITANRAADAVEAVAHTYDELIDTVGRTVRHHEVLVTVSVHDTGPDAIDILLLREIRLLSQRLETAGLSPSAPLGPDAWVRAMRLRLDPTNQFWHPERSLCSVAEQLTFAAAAPMAARAEWTHWITDDALHRSLYVVEWPRTDVPATWLGELLHDDRGVCSVTIGVEPVPRSRSQRSIARDAAKIASDVEHRAERGFRVGAAHRRATRAVDEREAELVAGYGEFTYAGIVTLTATTVADLDAATDRVTQRAASIGVELRPLHGRHDIAACVALPVARGFAPGARR